MEHWWNDNDKEKTEVLGENAIQFTFCPKQTPTLTGLVSS
jgi:hypothetical protein